MGAFFAGEEASNTNEVPCDRENRKMRSASTDFDMIRAGISMRLTGRRGVEADAADRSISVVPVAAASLAIGSIPTVQDRHRRGFSQPCGIAVTEMTFASRRFAVSF
jgi:hypothetical protein